MDAWSGLPSQGTPPVAGPSPSVLTPDNQRAYVPQGPTAYPSMARRPRSAAPPQALQATRRPMTVA
jgi:hypothetical protein